MLAVLAMLTMGTRKLNLTAVRTPLLYLVWG